MQRRTHQGFTLLELLIVGIIIALLAASGLVAYEAARANARDGKRVSDVRQIFVSLEFFFEQHEHYPADGVDGAGGVILGEGIARTLSDAGFAEQVQGQEFMVNVPANPMPGGIPYIYRSLNRDGSDCDRAPCETYALLFGLEGRQGNFLPGPHAQTPEGIVGAEGGSGVPGVTTEGGSLVGVQESAVRGVDGVVAAVRGFIEDPTVEMTARTAVAPVATAAALANAAAALPSAAAAWSLVVAALQPLTLLGRRRGRATGVVYDALSRVPVDLATVRLRDAGTGRVVASAVTDGQGRYLFLARHGAYRIEVIKPGYIFPSRVLTGGAEDVHFGQPYDGSAVRVDGESAIIAPNIPVDAAVTAGEGAATPRRAKKHLGIRRSIAMLSPMSGAVALAISPRTPVILLFATQIICYLLFRRLGQTPEPKTWGIIYEEATRRPVSGAVVRVFSMPYNKLIETKATDASGRYFFRVGPGKYFVTVTREGFLKTETNPIEVPESRSSAFIASNIPMRPVPRAPVTTRKPVPPLVPPVQPPPTPPARPPEPEAPHDAGAAPDLGVDAA
jgi:prepilin-type N-terminal cleavage/methylation domain-containing protein